MDLQANRPNYVAFDRPEPPPRRRRRWPWIAAAAVLAGAVAGALALATRGPAEPIQPKAATTITASGNIVLTLGQFEWTAMPSYCTGRGGYDDITVGAPVAVTDPSGKVVALGKLSNAVPAIDPEDPERATSCRLMFQVPNVPAGLGFYGVEVSHRGVVRMQEAELNRVQLSL